MKLQNILIFGNGISGQGLATYLEDKGINHKIWTDINPFEIDFNEFDGAYFSPGFRKTKHKRHFMEELVTRSLLPILSDFDILYHFNLNSKFIGITGTSGKTTTSYLISHLLSAGGIDNYLCGNMGINIFKDHSLYVMELSVLQLMDIKAITFDYGIITNLDIDHLDLLDTIESYKSNKYNILNKSYMKKQKFFLGDGVDQLKVNLLELEELPTLNNPCLNKLHNYKNVQIAYSIAKEFGLDKSVLKSLKNFKLPEARQQLFLTNNNINFINDSKATNSTSVIAAINSYDNILWLVGGRIKSNSLENNSLDFIKKLKNINKVICFGENGKFIHQFLEKINVNSTYVKSFHDVEHEIPKHLNGIKNVLLSPMGESFDEFKNFKERGQSFEKMINKMFKIK